MNIPLSRAHRMAMACIWAMLCALGLSLAGCGGGGASANNTPSSDEAAANGRTGTTLSVGPASLAGVVAIGTPVLDATVRVYDALGVDQGTATSNPTDGTYTLTLTTAQRYLPLFVQATGTDNEGTPVTVHSVVQTLTTGGATNTVQLNTLTDAVVAMLLGGDPAGFFATPAAYADWIQLSDRLALPVATAFLKTVLAANFRDAGLTNAATANFFSDGAFRADKTGIDAVLEAVRAQFGTATSNGNPTLLLSSRLALVGTTEVTVDLSVVRDLLAGTTSIANNTAIVSALKVTSGHTAAMPTLAGLNGLTAQINVAMARHYDFIQMSYEPLFDPVYTFFEGRSLIDSYQDLVDHGLADHQFSDFQVLGCLDDVIATTGCVRIGVAAQVRDANNNVVGVYRNAVSYTAQNGWRLRGNDRQTPWFIRPVAWQTWDGAGSEVTATPNTGEAANAGTGLQVVVIAREFMRATIQMPNNTAVVFIHCDLVNFTPMCLEPTQTGDLLRDQVIRTGFGNLDTAVGARYRILTETVGHGNEDNSTRLTAGLPTITSNSVFPLPDDMGASPVTVANVVAGLTVSWHNWALANPQLRMVEVFAVIRTPGLPVKTAIHRVPSRAARQATLDPFLTVPGDAQDHVLWMVAEDAYGRRYISKIIAQP